MVGGTGKGILQKKKPADMLRYEEYVEQRKRLNTNQMRIDGSLEKNHCKTHLSEFPSWRPFRLDR